MVTNPLKLLPSKGSTYSAAFWVRAYPVTCLNKHNMAAAGARDT